MERLDVLAELDGSAGTPAIAWVTASRPAGRPLTPASGLLTRRPGTVPAPDESFILDGTDTIASIRHAHRQACESSRRATAPLALDDIVYGNRRGPLPLRWVYLHTLRELAQHRGHADILREQIINHEPCP